MHLFPCRDQVPEFLFHKFAIDIDVPLVGVHDAIIHDRLVLGAGAGGAGGRRPGRVCEVPQQQLLLPVPQRHDPRACQPAARCWVLRHPQL